MTDYYLLNTNSTHLPDGNDGTAIYEQGIAATFGGRDDYGKKLADFDEGDIIISYVNGVGYRAVGRVTEEWDGQPVTDPEKWIDPEDNGEYHVGVRWQTVLDEDEAIDYQQANRLLGYPEDTPPNFTKKSVSDPDAGKRLADAIRGNRGTEPTLYLVAAGRNSDNLANTVGSPVEIETVRSHSDIDLKHDGTVAIWGRATDGDPESGPDVENGDYLFLYRRNAYRYAGRVQAQESNPELGAEIWESEADEQFDYIYYLTDVRELALSKTEFNPIVDYKANYYPQSFGEPGPERLALLRQKFGTIEEFVEAVSQQSVPERYRQIGDQLEEIGQVIFHGPPGTGKTYTAREFADWWLAEHPETVQTNDQFRLVTFHPSFTYEDFIEGLTSKSEDGSISYELEDGVFKEYVQEVQAWDGQEQVEPQEMENEPRYLFVIDEINRGNVAKILGETVTLLESDKREGAENELSVQLSHSDTAFTIPSNVYLIGTMNTADRSIALVDAAIRRRFGFVPFPPDYEALRDHYGFDTVADVSAAYSQDDAEGLQALSIGALEEINEAIRDRPDLGKGKQIGHAYLFGRESEADLVKGWKYEILPLLEEYFFGSFSDLQQEVFGDCESAYKLIDWDYEEIRQQFAPETTESEADALRGVLRELVGEEL